VPSAIAPSRVGYFRERSPVAIESGFPTGKVLPAGDDDVDECGIEFNTVTDPLARLGGDQSRSASQEGFVHGISSIRVIDDGPAHDLDRLLAGVTRSRLIVFPVDLPECGLVIGALPVGRLPFPDRVITRLMLPVVVAAGDRIALFAPDE